MGNNGIFRPMPSVRVGTLLLVLILSFKVIETEALWGWLGGTRNEKDSEAGSGTSLTREFARDAAFELDSVQVLGSTARGKELYDQSTSLMAGHTCWQKAYAGMRTGCREILNDETKKSRLGLRLTDCFLMTSGRRGLKDCPNSAPVVSCVRSLDDHTHAIFLAFFVDIAAMCHYLQSEEFKQETERAVKLLKDSAHKTQDKLDTMNIHLDAQQSQLMEHTGYVLEAQEILQKGHEALQESIQQGMEKIQESSNHVRSGLEDVYDMQKDVARKHEELSDVMATELSDLQHKSNILANSLGSLYGSVEDLAEQSKAGREQAMKSLTDLQELHEGAREQSKQDLQRISYEALKVYDSYRSWQAQLGGAHEHLVESASQITRNHETILSKQAHVNKLIMEVLEALMAIQKGWIFESRVLRSAGVYVGASVLVFIATTAKKTRSARLILYIGLFAALSCEIYIVHYGLEDVASKESDTLLPSNVGLVRYTFCAMALAFLLYTFFTYKDYKFLNYKLLAENADVMNNLAKDINRMVQEMRNLASRQAQVEDALGIPKELLEAKAQRRARFVAPRKPPSDGPAKAQKDRRVQTSPY